MNRAHARDALRRARLYAILDTAYSDPASWPRLAQQLIAGGTGILQIRAKHSPPEDITRWTREVHAVTSPAGIPLILNDHPALVPETGAEGAHVGQDDLSVAAARALAGPDTLIGKSTHSPQQAAGAFEEHPDYIGFGPIFATPTKPDYPPIGPADIAAVCVAAPVPVFCIGGIKEHNVAALAAAGASRVVIVSGLLQAPDPATTARAVLVLLPPLPTV